MLRGIVVGLIAVAACGCGGSQDSQTPEEYEPVAEPLGGTITATFEGQDVVFKSGVAFTFDTPNEYYGVTAGAVEVWLSNLSIDCNYHTKHPYREEFLAMIAPLDTPVGQYNGVAHITRVRQGAKRRGDLCTATLTKNDPQTVAGNVQWDHADMTSMAGDFEVKHCGTPTQ